MIATVRLRRGKAATPAAPRNLSARRWPPPSRPAAPACASCARTRSSTDAGVIAACRRAGAHFSVTCGMNPSVKRAVLAIDEAAWQQITYPTAVPDPDTGELIFDAQVAEIPAYTAFASRKKSEQATARLIVRRVRDLAKPAVVGEQGELFPVWRYHPFFTDNPAPTLVAEREHRHHAVVEQVIADSKSRSPRPPALGPLPCQRSLADPVGDGLRPAPRRRCPDLGLPHQGHHRHLAHPPRPCPARIARSARASPCTYRTTGPGNTPGRTCSTLSTAHPKQPDVPDHLARQGPTGAAFVEELGRPADTPCPPTATAPHPAHKPRRRSFSSHVGGSRLSHA